MSESQQPQQPTLTTSSNISVNDRSKANNVAGKTSNSDLILGKPHALLHKQHNQLTPPPSLNETPTKQFTLPDLPMSLGGVSSEVKSSNLIRSVPLQHQQKLLNGILNKSNSPMGTFNFNDFLNDYQKTPASNNSNTNDTSKNVLKAKNPTSSNKANLSYMNIKDNDSTERSASKATIKSNINGMIYSVIFKILIVFMGFKKLEKFKIFSGLICRESKLNALLFLKGFLV